MNKDPLSTHWAWRWWLYLTREERRMLLIILLIALIGLTARYLYLRQQSPDPIPAEAIHPSAQ